MTRGLGAMFGGRRPMQPKFKFVGVTRRYGQGVSRNVAEMVAAALAPPEVADVDAAWACGTCQIRAV
jgi:hypothetical protein